VSGATDAGGLAGRFQFTNRVAYSYVVLGKSNVNMLAGSSSGSSVAINSYSVSYPHLTLPPTPYV